MKLFRDNKERQTLSLGFSVDAIFGGAMLACRSGQDFIFFYDWETGSPVQRIDVAVKNGVYKRTYMHAHTRACIHTCMHTDCVLMWLSRMTRFLVLGFAKSS